MNFAKALQIQLGLLLFLGAADSFAASGLIDRRTEAEKQRSKEQIEYEDLYDPDEGAYSSLNAYSYPFKELGINRYSGYMRKAVPISQEFNFEKLVEVINRKGLKTIESVIDELPENMKNHNYVLMYRSRSLQAASPKSPRAILSTPTASFMISFNGGGLQRGGNTMEVIQFRFDQKKFEFRELAFDDVNPPQISAANPAKCVECHQSPARKNVDLRPNWEPYSHWIGAFGANGGSFIRGKLKEDYDLKKIIQPQDHAAMEEQAQEFDLFKNYIHKVAPKHPRFSRLGKFSIKAPTELTEQLGFLNMIRVSRLMIEQTEIFSKYRQVLDFITLCYSPSGLKNSKAMNWHLGFKYPQYHESGGFSLNDLKSISSAVTMIFEPLGVDTSDWSMDFGTGGRFAFRERFGTPVNPQQTWASAWKWLLKDLPDLSAVSCSEMQERAVVQMDQAYAEGWQERIRAMNLSERPAPPTGAEVANRCARCHVEDRAFGIPYIPFDRPDLLSEKLKGSLFSHIQDRTSDMAVQADQMPPRGRLSAVERNALINYLKEISNEN